MPLTALQVRRAKPGRHSDGGGLYLLVKESGSRSWVLRVQLDGQRKDWGIGGCLLDPSPELADVPLVQRKALTLAEAREKARIGRQLAKAGIDPAKEWKREELEVPTFENAARGYHKEVAKAWKNGKHGAQWLTTLENYAFPIIGDMLVNEIEADDLQKVLLPIWLEKGETARRVKQRALAVLDYAQGRKWRQTEAPARSLDKLMKGIKQPKGGNFPAMPWEDAPAFIERLRSADESVGRMALLFCILTAARSGEVRKAKWQEMRLDVAEWHMPPANTKTGKPHIVPLVPAAVDILKRLQGLFGHKPNEPVFVGNKGKPISDATMTKALNVAGGEAYTVHGFRSTFRDWAADHNFADSWAEAALAHGNPDKTEAAYRRTTFFNHRRDKLMPAWASYLLADNSNVISLAEARA